MAAYSLTQFVSVMICYNFGTNLSDIQFLYIDLFLITVFASCFGMTKPYEGWILLGPSNGQLEACLMKVLTPPISNNHAATGAIIIIVSDDSTFIK